jgi:hypothetical protein
MSATDGKLVPSYEVHCAICEEPALGLGRTVRQAEKELLEHRNWRKHISLGWCCLECSYRRKGVVE